MSEETSAIVPFIGKQAELLEHDLVAFQEELQKDIEAQLYLEDDRMLEEGVVEKFRLGLVPDAYSGYEKYAGMIVIPYLSLAGKPVAMRYRNLGEDGPKYLSREGDPSLMYNVSAVHKAVDSIHICEGEFDCMILEQCGLNAVGFPGANTWKPRHYIAFKGFSTVYVWGDPDRAGQEFNAKLLKAMSQAVPVRLHGGDVSETYATEGESGIMELVRGALR